MTPISETNLRRLAYLLAHPTALPATVRAMVANWLMTGVADLEENRRVRYQFADWVEDPMQRFLFFVASRLYHIQADSAWYTVCQTYKITDEPNI